MKKYMRSKLTGIFRDISEYEEREKESLTPEYIALRFMEFIERKTGKKLSYFRNTKRNGSEAWKYFDKLSDSLREWRSKGITINLNRYFERHFKIIGRGKNLYPSQLVLPRRYQYYAGRGSVDPAYINNYDDKPSGYDEYLNMLKYLTSLQKTSQSESEVLREEGDLFPPWFHEEYRHKGGRTNRIIKAALSNERTNKNSK